MTDGPPPTADDIAELAERALAAIPARLAQHVKGVGITVEDMPDDETLDDLGIESAWELTGLYRGIPLTERSLGDVAPQPDLIFLYRQPILLEWIETGETLYPPGAQRADPRDRASLRLQRRRHRGDRTRDGLERYRAVVMPGEGPASMTSLDDTAQGVDAGPSPGMTTICRSTSLLPTLGISHGCRAFARHDARGDVRHDAGP